ncbi:rhamnogalacturonan endolyase [Salvia divinorum]|uniref:Rhamnogalacturonan endolyase n=1 Tax=Salvia divinorum TaxID=28513 RepID=A0ABD1FTW2_SALDI
MGEIVYEPTRDGPTLWDIGIPDRTARQFYVPDPNPKYINKLYVNHPDRFRQYGLWERYGELYPNGDLVYTIGESNYTTDWFFAHVTRKYSNSYKATTWQIKFKLEAVEPNGKYYLRLSIASANQAELQVRINNPDQNPALFTTGLIGKDNAIARHGIHGLYWLFNVEISANLFIKGINTIYLTQANASGPFQGIIYDYIRLESPK